MYLYMKDDYLHYYCSYYHFYPRFKTPNACLFLSIFNAAYWFLTYYQLLAEIAF
uniref:Uncharacterized protein n=1 Tax=Aegilops tauschii subsp. strangulata TaxID=200361 RepID=A0A453FET8_AEGTS